MVLVVDEGNYRMEMREEKMSLSEKLTSRGVRRGGVERERRRHVDDNKVMRRQVAANEMKDMGDTRKSADKRKSREERENI